MFKVVLGIVAVVIVLGGAYWFLRGQDPAQGSAEPAQNLSSGSVEPGQGSASASATSSVSSDTSNAAPTINIQNKNMRAVFHTSMGDVTVEFYPDQAPKAVENFVKLAQAGFYDGTKFHRVIEGFMDQGGDPLTKDDSQMAKWGTGGPGYTIADEFGTTYTNTAGTIAMANTGAPNSSGSQFFFNAVDNHFLDGKYSVFGKVVSGMDVVEAINKVPTNSSDRPLAPVVLKNVVINQ